MKLKKILSIVIFILFNLKSHSQKKINCNHWVYKISFNQKQSFDSAILNHPEFKEYLTNRNIEMIIYFSLFSFEINKKNFFYLQYDSINTNQKIDENFLKSQNCYFGINFKNKTFTSDSKYILYDSLTNKKDTTVNARTFFYYNFRKMNILASDKIKSIEENFFTLNSKEIKVVDKHKTYEFIYNKSARDLIISKEKIKLILKNNLVKNESKGILDFLIF